MTSKGGYARSYITKAGNTWFKDAADRIKEQRTTQVPITSELEVNIDLFTCRIQDIDNVAKPILDVLQKEGLIHNDNLIYRLCMEKFKCKQTEERVEVELGGYVAE